MSAPWSYLRAEYPIWKLRLILAKLEPPPPRGHSRIQRGSHPGHPTHLAQLTGN
jgi:hypothetical protein